MLKQRRHLAITVQFRMDTLQKALRVNTQVCVMALEKKIETAYYSGPICPERR